MLLNGLGWKYIFYTHFEIKLYFSLLNIIKYLLKHSFYSKMKPSANSLYCKIVIQGTERYHIAQK